MPDMAQNSLRTFLHQKLFDDVRRNAIAVRKFLARRKFIKRIEDAAIQVDLKQALDNGINTLFGFYLKRRSCAPETTFAMNQLDTTFGCQNFVRSVNRIDGKFETFRHFAHRRHFFAIMKTGVYNRFFYIFNQQL